MGRQRGQTSKVERELIIYHHKQGKCLREIGKIVNRSHATVQSVIKRFKKGQGTENKEKGSSRKIFSPQDARWIIRELKKNPTISAPKLAAATENLLGKKAHPETKINSQKTQFSWKNSQKQTFY